MRKDSSARVPSAVPATLTPAHWPSVTQHLLLLPIRALAGFVAYATCPFILRRYANDLLQATRVKPPAVPELADTQALHGTGSENLLAGKIVLEDLDLEAKLSDLAEEWASRIAKSIFSNDLDAEKDLTHRFVILPDAVFSFLAETATEIRARIAIDKGTGTVKDGALWYEENLPAESVLWGIFALSASRVPDEKYTADELTKKIPENLLLQLGGKAGVGRGLTRFVNGGGQ